MSADAEVLGPDLSLGVLLTAIPDGGTLVGHVAGQPVLIVRQGHEVFAVGSTCTHYGAPLADGVVVGDTVRCPWHHACFSLRTGEAVGPPALKPLARWDVERRGHRIFVQQTMEAAPPARRPRDSNGIQDIVIVGAGAAGDAAADMLRRQGYDGRITLIGNDEAPPYDRPNLSKDYLAGTASEEWIPLRSPEFYKDAGIRLLTGRQVRRVSRERREVRLDDGSAIAFDRLLLATGARPVRLPEPLDNRVHHLRTLADSRAIIGAAQDARAAIVLGASFVGLEVAASLRARGLEVHVVAPEAVPLERIMGTAVGRYVRRLHETRGVVFHLERRLTLWEGRTATLSDGELITADLVVAGVGVRPNSELAEEAQLVVEGGIVVDEQLRTNDPAIFAAGDVARFPDAVTGDLVRIEHWAVAQRMGQVAARNMLGAGEAFDAVPFFWSRHFDTTISYVGHATAWDDLSMEGSIDAGNFAATFKSHGRTLAVATVGRDRDSLNAEVAMERALAVP